MKNRDRISKNSTSAKEGTFQIKLALSYSALLLLCFILGIWLYCMSSGNAKNEFWRQQEMRLAGSVASLDQTLSTMDSYTRQLMTDSTFIRFSNMKSTEDALYFSTAYTVKETLSSRLFSIVNLPVTDCHIYLKNTNFVISGSQFTEVRQYYRDYMRYDRERYDDWLAMLSAAGASPTIVDASDFSKLPNTYWLVRDVDAIMGRSVPAVIWFEWNSDKMKDWFLTATPPANAFLLLRDENGHTMLTLTGNSADADVIRHIDAAPTVSLSDLHTLCYTSPENGWQYVLALPESLCTDALGSYDLLFVIMALLVLLGAGLLTMALVRQNMKPIHQLGEQLQVVRQDNAQLMNEIDAQRPMLCASYLRRVLSGHIASEQEFEYTMKYLRLDKKLNFLVLYGVVYSQDKTVHAPLQMYQAVEERLPVFLGGDQPMYYYANLDHDYIILTAFDESVADPLMALQRQVVALHDDLLSKESLWFYAGIGLTCSEPRKLWESYEQARTAARYTAKHHVFVPYEMMQKESSSVYYPVEISAKLQHFISTGNKPQVMEMFALIHHENVEERSLPINRLNFLLSDIKNTLLRARFQIVPQTDAERDRLSHIDQRMEQLSTFALCESVALSLCDFFTGSAEPSDPIPEVKQYLREHFADPSLCLGKLSDLFHISESYLSHMFKERTGENLSAYLENIRMNEAARLLQQGMTDEHGKEVSLNNLYMCLGYNNATSFRRAFKKRYGITPSEMRDNHRAATE